MGGKGSEPSHVMQQYYGPTGAEADAADNSWTWKDTGTQTPPAVEKKTAAPPAPITEDPTKQAGTETIKQDAETQPYAPPGWGNYGKGTNVSPLGDLLVAGMAAQPGKPGPTPNYSGQV